MLPDEGDDITLRLAGQETRILTAIGEVSQEVKHVKAKVQETAEVVARLDERSLAQKDRVTNVEQDVRDLKRTDKIVGGISSIVGAAIGSIVALLSRDR